MKTFSFNLIPQKTKEETQREVKRDNASLYTALLPLLGVSVWLALTLFNGLVVDKVKANWETSIAKKQARVDTEFLPVRIQHGELVLKTRILADIILKDIKPETLFALTEQIFPVPEPEVQVIGYGRNDDGSFDVILSTSNYRKFAEVARRFSEYDGADEATISSVNYNKEADNIQGVITFFIDVDFIEQEDAQT